MAVQDAQEEIWQRVIVFVVESQVLAVLEPTARGPACSIVVGTAVEIGCHEHASGIEHSAVGLFCSLQVGARKSPQR